MGFMQSYKRLDNLCKDINGIGVTGYINDMVQSANGSFHVPNWESDFQNLKHYRHIRNQIAHDNFASEETLCSPEDTLWVEDFYQRILTETDPLAIYFQKTQPRSKASSPAAAAPPSPRYIYLPMERQTPPKRSNSIPAIVFIVILVIAIILSYFS